MAGLRLGSGGWAGSARRWAELAATHAGERRRMAGTSSEKRVYGLSSARGKGRERDKEEANKIEGSWWRCNGRRRVHGGGVR